MKQYPLIFFVVLFTGCASPKLVSSWKSPEADAYQVNKVLVIGMSQNPEVRTLYENQVARALTAKGYMVERSMDLFDKEFIASKQTESDLDEVEQHLLTQGFDAILLAKIIGTENRKTFKERLNTLDRMYNQFSSDYLDNQKLYKYSDQYETSRIYITETSLYCICLDRERTLIWRGVVNVNEPVNMERTMDSYITIIINAMGKEAILF